jgi:hypothetical protein
MQENINSLDYEKIGAMMNLHQALLSISAFAPPGLHEILRKLRTIESILGVKPSCSRPHGAYIALVEGDPMDIVQHLPEWIHPVSTFVTPTAGIQALPTQKINAKNSIN